MTGAPGSEHSLKRWRARWSEGNGERRGEIRPNSLLCFFYCQFISSKLEQKERSGKRVVRTGGGQRTVVGFSDGIGPHIESFGRTGVCGKSEAQKNLV